LSYQIIHAHVLSLNEAFGALARITSECYELAKYGETGKSDDTPLIKWGDYIIAQYKNVMDVIWHIEHHLRNPKKPDLKLFNKTHDRYIQFHNELDKGIKDIIEKAKKLSRDDFEVVLCKDWSTLV